MYNICIQTLCVYLIKTNINKLKLKGSVSGGKS